MVWYQDLGIDRDKASRFDLSQNYRAFSLTMFAARHPIIACCKVRLSPPFHFCPINSMERCAFFALGVEILLDILQGLNQKS